MATNGSTGTDLAGTRTSGAPSLPRQAGPSDLLERRALPPRPAPQRRPMPQTALGSTPRWAVVALAATVAALMLGVGAVVAVPFFMAQRDRAVWAGTTVALPATVNGRVKNNAAPVGKLLGTQLQVNRLTARNVGVYGPVDMGVIAVMAARTPEWIDEQAQASLRRRYLAGFEAAGGKLTLSEVQAGELGGWFGCGKANTGLNVCVGTDHASLAVVMMGPEVKNPEQVARKTRELTVVRD